MTETPEYCHGTQRVYDPQETLKRVMPLAKVCGISRVLDITYLDRIGIPTYNAIRPNGIVLSISNGKGLTKEAASVSAIMESIEVEHSEYPLTTNWRLSTSARALESEGRRVIDPKLLIQDCLWPKDEYGGLYYSKDVVLDWVAGTELMSGDQVMLPASTIYTIPPFLHYFTSNGLASGNTFAEATLHAVCEIIERDAVARLIGRGENSPPSGLRTIRFDTMPEPLVRLSVLIAAAGIEMFLISVPCAIEIYAFWAIFYCPREPTFILRTSTGYGAHTDPAIAACRAVTEAAQARLAHIHGAREDLGIDHVNRQMPEAEQVERSKIQAGVFEKFRRMRPWGWEELIEVYPYRAQGLDIQASLDLVLEMLRSSDRKEVFVHELTKPNINIPVVKVFVPGMKLSAKML